MPLASPQTQPTEQLADAPFDDAQADLILRSSDEVPVNFRVFKKILSPASPVFADMFNIPSPPSTKPHDDVQVVPLSEHSTALDIALRHIYPVQRTPPPNADNLHYARILAEFARKYQVGQLDQFCMGYLAGSIECDPVGVYAIAVTHGYDDIGRKAAQSCLNVPFYDLRSPYLPYATAEHISELLRYHVACGDAASSVASSDRSWILQSTSDLHCHLCAVTVFTHQTSPGGPIFNNHSSEDDDERLLTTRNNPSPTGCVDLLASFDPCSCTPPDSRSSHSGSLCIEDQWLSQMCPAYATIYG